MHVLQATLPSAPCHRRAPLPTNELPLAKNAYDRPGVLTAAFGGGELRRSDGHCGFQFSLRLSPWQLRPEWHLPFWIAACKCGESRLLQRPSEPLTNSRRIGCGLGHRLPAWRPWPWRLSANRDSRGRQCQAQRDAARAIPPMMLEMVLVPRILIPSPVRSPRRQRDPRAPQKIARPLHTNAPLLASNHSLGNWPGVRKCRLNAD